MLVLSSADKRVDEGIKSQKMGIKYHTNCIQGSICRGHTDLLGVRCVGLA